MAHFQAFEKAANASGEDHLKKLTAVAKEGFELMRNIVLALATSKRVPAEEIAPVVSAPLTDLYKKVGKMINKDFKLKNHAKAIEDGLKVLQFFLQMDAPEWSKEMFNQIDYFGNKILMEQNSKWTAWYNIWRKDINGNL
jgi:adenylyl cyclase-associated protein